MSADTLNLTESFPAPTAEEWRALVEKALKGADFEKRLVSRTADGIAIQPLYERRKNADVTAGPTAGRPWRISARVDLPAPAACREQALEDLTNGVDSLTLVFPGALAARGYGLQAESVADLDAALGDVVLDMIHLRLDPAPAYRANAALVAALAERRGHNPAALSIDFGLDPIASRGGALADDSVWQLESRRLADAAATLKEKGYAGPYVTCDVRPYHEAGASEAQELAIALATGVAYLRALTDHGWSGEDAAKALSFTLAIDADQVLGIAKLRALRRLWSQIETASGIAPTTIRINAESAWRMLTRRDPWVNMLRGTMATFVAGIGGADTMTVLPHTQPLGLPDAFARRIARNTQSVLIEESNLWRVADPTAGSGAYEAMTDALAEKGWALFQEIEREGGVLKSLEAGALPGRIEAVRTARETDVARRKVQITGTSEFPLLAEGALDVLDIAAISPAGAAPSPADSEPEFDAMMRRLQDGETLAAVSAWSGCAAVSPLPSVRLGEPFEALRDKADAHKNATGAFPQVFLASLGPIAAHTVRSTWMKNLLGAGGIEALTADGFETPTAAAEAFKASGAKVAAICSSDAIYAEMAAETAKALKAAGASRILFAGKPGDLENALKAAGVDTFVFAGQDVLTLLAALQDEIIGQ